MDCRSLEIETRVDITSLSEIILEPRQFPQAPSDLSFCFVATSFLLTSQHLARSAVGYLSKPSSQKSIRSVHLYTVPRSAITLNIWFPSCSGVSDVAHSAEKSMAVLFLLLPMMIITSTPSTVYSLHAFQGYDTQETRSPKHVACAEVQPPHRPRLINILLALVHDSLPRTGDAQMPRLRRNPNITTPLGSCVLNAVRVLCYFVALT